MSWARLLIEGRSKDENNRAGRHWDDPLYCFRGWGEAQHQACLTKVPDSVQEGHFFGLQRPSFSCPHFSHLNIAMVASFFDK